MHWNIPSWLKGPGTLFLALHGLRHLQDRPMISALRRKIGPSAPRATNSVSKAITGPRARAAFARGINSGELEWDEELLDSIYKCTICAGCQSQCQVDYKPHIPEVFEALRRKAVEDGFGPMPAQKVIAQSLRSYDNPYQGPRRVLTDWTRPFKKEKRPIKDILKEPAPVFYFVGCTGAYNVPDRVIAQATASIFQKLGVDFGILGENELCCGSTAMRLGDAEAFKRVAETNLETFRKLHQEQGVKTIVTACAGCFRAILKDYSLAEEYRIDDGRDQGDPRDPFPPRPV